MEVNRFFRYAIQYAQACIAIYSLLQGEDDRRNVHREYMKPLRAHLNSVRDRLNVLLQQLDVTISEMGMVNSQSFLGPMVQGLNSYLVDFCEAARLNAINLDHTIRLLSDELIAPGFDYTSHPKTLPAIPDARKRLSAKASLRKAALGPLRYINGLQRNSTQDTVRRWMNIIMKARRAQVV